MWGLTSVARWRLAFRRMIPGEPTSSLLVPQANRGRKADSACVNFPTVVVQTM